MPIAIKLETVGHHEWMKEILKAQDWVTRRPPLKKEMPICRALERRQISLHHVPVVNIVSEMDVSGQIVKRFVGIACDPSRSQLLNIRFHVPVQDAGSRLSLIRKNRQSITSLDLQRSNETFHRKVPVDNPLSISASTIHDALPLRLVRANSLAARV